MSTTPNPKLVKEIAQEIVMSNIHKYADLCRNSQPSNEEFHSFGADEKTVAAFIQELIPGVLEYVSNTQQNVHNIDQIVQVYNQDK